MPAALLSEQQKVDLWVGKAFEKQLPILSGTLGEIEAVLAKDGYSAADLAHTILQDPPLTTRVLRMANSAYYNASGKQISMVSRAVIVLGFDVVRSICASVALIEAFLNKVPRGRLLDEIARALHAAVVARFLAKHTKDPAPEEVFVSTLLRRIGHMVFWSLGEYEVEALDMAMRNSQEGTVRLEIDIVGFPLRKLSTALIDAWHLPVMVPAETEVPNSRKALDEVAWAVAFEAPKGWTTLEMRRVVRDFAWLTSASEDDALAAIKSLSQEAYDYAQQLGSKDVALRIPVASGQSSVGVHDDDPSAMCEGDKDVELRVLHEIANNLLEHLDVNSILHMVLEGIHRGVGMDRTALAIVDPRGTELRCKLALGKDRHRFIERFTFPVANTKPHALTEIVQKGGGQMFDPGVRDPNGMFVHPVYELFEGSSFLAQAIVVNGRTMGVFVADRHSSSRPLDKEVFDNFRLLGQQANIALAMAATSHS